MLPSVTCPAVQYFSTLSHKWHDFRKKKLLNTKRVICFSLQLLCKPFLILRRTEGDIIINVYWSSCKVPVILVRCYSRKIVEKHSYEISRKSSSGSRVVPCERTDLPKLIVAFRNFANAPENGK
jgi:hypothetical protein